jgi:anti-anti-sigma factor
MAAVSTSPTRVVVDLTDVTLFDSSAIHALLVGWSAADGGETEVTVVCANPWIPQVLEIAGIPELSPSRDDHERDRRSPSGGVDPPDD